MLYIWLIPFLLIVGLIAWGIFRGMQRTREDDTRGPNEGDKL